MVLDTLDPAADFGKLYTGQRSIFVVSADCEVSDKKLNLNMMKQYSK